MRIHVPTFIVIIGCTVLSCKPKKSDDSNQIESIDVIMQESLQKNRSNTCGFTPQLTKNSLTSRQKKLMKRTARLRLYGAVDEKDVYGVLAAVPDVLHRQFFQGFNGVLEARVDAQNLCQKLAAKVQNQDSLSEEQATRLRDLKGCWTVRYDKTGQPEQATIYITSDYRIIHNSLLPLLTFFFSEYIIDKWLPQYAKLPNADSSVIEQGRLLTETRVKLAKAMLVDLKKRANGSELIDMYKDFFKLPATIDSASDADLLPFGTYVMAEAMDSRYCSKASLKTFKTDDYQATYAAFKPLSSIFGRAWFEK